ncbi:Fic family protein [Lujinxingia vulgaris]|uniref:Fic family protein n=1 Tax=Lujinxingia vulgaris TaxID=2600176 RepID=A0A5C6XIE0_9DELT|nr:Fic family protein [Lujinxingia vulgaris]
MPENASPAGYVALIHGLGLSVPPPRRLFATDERYSVREEGRWTLMTPRHVPATTLEGHLTFALRYEGVDLGLLKAVFKAVGPEAIAAIVRGTPTGIYARRLWFLYEWLTQEPLDLPNAERGNYVDAIDPAMQLTIASTNSRRHRVRNNLPGTPGFCPLVYRSEKVASFLGSDLKTRAWEAVARVPADVLLRAAAFLLLKDSRASYAIEGEHPPADRVQRWGRAIGEAGENPLSVAELLRLQRVVIGDARFVRLGLRDEHGFVGEHARGSGEPIPDHISARPDDLPELMEALIAFANGPAEELDPIVAAALLAFGFVYIHPFADGNGRIHRYLIHHVLSRRGFHPPGVVFPISTAILDRITDYRGVLESYSTRLLPHIDWTAAPDNNVEVHNRTADFYRYFDATPHVEFLFECVQKTIEVDLPAESTYLQRYDAFCRGVQAMVDMPSATLDLLFRFLEQNGGALSKRAREGEFEALSAAEVAEIEAIYRDVFRESR